MNIMKLFGFDSDDDDYDDSDDYTEERKRKPAPRKENARSGSSGKLILFNVKMAVSDEDKRRLCDEFNNGAMILIDMHELTQRDYEEFGHNFITFMKGVAFARGGDGRGIDPAQYILTPRSGMFEVWPKEDINE
ncbi:MAG: cell division protein SepF [Synergistaceae bacterium]|nr:cell division protein SepF [Synergistaceae bacterium]MBQ3450089.1 cell division protein SepF [Synergistaceae bacterium]MBQ3693802.1 cell division protein SepF [Synergistaceae bacterium]MBR0250808.1 cell division protein SepF [Synergistaceae bacterium]